jgi:hypothetical protein
MKHNEHLGILHPNVTSSSPNHMRWPTVMLPEEALHLVLVCMMVGGSSVSSNYFFYSPAGLLVICATTVSVQGILLGIVQMWPSAIPVGFQGKDY